uniref:MATH domain-containing protein n=1 Tax=Panagrellus redivivus TaxID=6233 RepID=A0A7E4ZUF1_PANRE
MEGRLTAPPEIGCSHGSSSSRAYQKDESSGSGTSSPGRSNSSNSGSTSDECAGRCSVSRDECNSSPEDTQEDSVDGDVNRQLLNILVTANNFSGDMLITDNAMSSLKDYFKHTMNPEQLSRLRHLISTNHVSSQTDPDADFPPLAIMKNPTIVNSSFADIATTSEVHEGVLPLVIRNFSQMTETMRGPVMGIRGVPWRIMVMPRQHVVQKKGTQKCLGFFLQCCPTAYSDSWSCQANAELRLISQKQDVPNFTRKTSHSYTAKENDWGYSCFMTWADILDEGQGYIKDNTVKVEVHVRADPPKNILDLAQFQKKVREYIRLADVQAQRGFIDKAIEVNTSATKFCKDKDPQCKSELEAQLQRLIDMKLKQSIERIEKGSSTRTVEDDGTSNMNALRQAMGGGLTARAQKLPKTSKASKDVEACKKDLQMAKAHFRAQKANREERLTKAPGERTRIALSTRPANAIPLARRSGPPPVHKAQTLVATGHFNESVCSPTKSNFRRVINGSLPEVEEPSDASGDNISEAGGESISQDQIDIKVTASEDGSETKINFTKVMNTLKNFNPEFSHVIQKSFQFKNPAGIGYNEEDAFIEELTYNPVNPNELRDTSVQTDNVEDDLVLVTESAIVDAASKTTAASSDEKMRKVKRVRKNRKPDDTNSVESEPKNRNDDANFAGKIDVSQEPGSPGTYASVPYSDNISLDAQDNVIVDYDEGTNDQIKPRYFSAPPMGLAFQMNTPSIEADDDEEAQTQIEPSMTYIDLILKQNINHLVREFHGTNKNGHSLNNTAETATIRGFPGYSAHSNSEFNQRLAQNALNIVSVNCLNFSACVTRIFKFFTLLNVSGKATAFSNAIGELNCAIHELPNYQPVPINDSRDLFAEVADLAEPNDSDYTLEKSYRRLCEFMSNECRTVVAMYNNFEYADTVHHAITVINELRQQNNSLMLQDQASRNTIRQLEEKKNVEVSEIRNSNNSDKEKLNELQKQLREAKKEIKRQEKKLKGIVDSSEDVKTLTEALAVSERKLTELNSKHTEMIAQHAREKQSSQDTKNNLVKEKQNLDSEVKSLKNTIEDLKASNRKLEQQLGTERRQAQANIKAEKERANKAECAQVENILELGLKILERAREDCKLQIKLIDNHLAKIANPTETEIDITKKNVEEWTKKAEEIKTLISTSKAEAQNMMNEIKKGKLLSSLPKFTVPKPPPHPVLHQMPAPTPIQPPATLAPLNPPQQLPIGSQRRTSPQIMVPPPNYGLPGQYRDTMPMISPSQQKPRGSVTPQPPYRGMPSASTPFLGGHGRPNSTVGIPQSPKPGNLPLPIGSRPDNYNNKNGIMSMQQPLMKDNIDSAAAMLSAASSNGMTSPAVRGLNLSPPNGFNNINSNSHDLFSLNSTSNRNGNNATPWYDPLNTYNDYFSTVGGPSRWSLGNFGSNSTDPSVAYLNNDSPPPATTGAIGSNRRQPVWPTDAEDFSSESLGFK